LNLGILLFILAIQVVIAIHEAGHLLMAKLFRFKASQYFIGFGPTLWSMRRGETEYGFKGLPLGGFVKIIGMNPYEEVAQEDQARSYTNKPRWQRALVLVAGSATHWVVAFLLLVFASMAIGFPTGEATTVIESVTGEIDGSLTAAGELGLEPDDRIVGIAGTTADEWNEISRYIKQHPGETITFEVERGGEVTPLDVELGQAIFSEDGEVVAYAGPGEELRSLGAGETRGGFLGVSPLPEFETKALPGAISDAGYFTWDVTKRSVEGIGQVFGMVFDGQLWSALTGSGERAIDEGPLGIVSAGRIAGQTVSSGHYLDFIGLVVGFTIFVGLMNLLPLPPLDGGHLAVVAYEAITGRSVDLRKLIPVAAAVISFFVLLFLAVLYLDLARPISVPL
jgi:membrane-associated protease RseP (regulator of RpoE activity)